MYVPLLVCVEVGGAGEGRKGALYHRDKTCSKRDVLVKLNVS